MLLSRSVISLLNWRLWLPRPCKVPTEPYKACSEWQVSPNAQGRIKTWAQLWHLLGLQSPKAPHPMPVSPNKMRGEQWPFLPTMLCSHVYSIPLCSEHPDSLHKTSQITPHSSQELSQFQSIPRWPDTIMEKALVRHSHVSVLLLSPC